MLQAADILLYDAHEVPVGEDQKQHVELTRDIAQRFNHLYEEEFFVLPEPVIPTQGRASWAWTIPTNKMSKSLAYVRGHAIRLLDEPKEIMRSFKRAVTDSGNEIALSRRSGEGRRQQPAGHLQGRHGQERGTSVQADFADARGYGDLKKGVAEVVIELLTPIQARYEALMADPAELDRLLARGAEQARAVAEPKVAAMKEIMGLTAVVSAIGSIHAEQTMLVVIDNYDSFTYNLVQYFGELGQEIQVFRNDAVTVDEIARAGAGPHRHQPRAGDPDDGGISQDVIRELGPTTPILGVCLGHQCMGQVYGGVVSRAPRLMHGKTSPVYHNGKGVFHGVPSPFNATRYHSLIVEEPLPEVLQITAFTSEGEVMGLRHREYPGGRRPVSSGEHSDRARQADSAELSGAAADRSPECGQSGGQTRCP